MKNILILLFSVFAVNFCVSQSQNMENLKKYWRFRERLKNFVVPGDCQGCSLPSKLRNFPEDYRDTIQNGYLHIKHASLEFSDETIHLGHYIGMLAMEYGVLLSKGETSQIEKTKSELAHAFNRLDETAEESWQTYFTGSVGIDTDQASNTDNYKLAVNGNIRAKKIVVETNWMDKVFDKEYVLPSLREVEDYIKANGHLPNIPSGKEIETNGGDLGELVKLQMQKIEELTLYVIELNKKIEKLQFDNKQI